MRGLEKALLPALLLLFVPALASAQGKKEKAEAKQEKAAEAVEVVPTGPPEPPRALKRAKKDFDEKQWPLASIGFYAVVKSEEDSYYHPEARYFLAQCLEQMALPYSALEEYSRYFATEDEDPARLDVALENAVSLARRLDAGWLVAPGLSRLDTSRIPAGARGPAMYWVGRFHFTNFDFAAAQAFLSLVPKETEFYAEARMLEGISLTHPANPNRNPALAVAPLASGLAAADKDRADSTTFEVANVNLARAYYALGNFERAIEHFERTPRSSPLWYESLYEASWSYFRLGRLSGALSHLQTVDAPFFDGVYHPDATLLRILIFYYLCKYIDGQEMLNGFTTRHNPIAKELEAALAKAETDPGGLFQSIYAFRADKKEAGIDLPDPVKQLFQSDEDVVRVGTYLAGIQKEQKRVDEIKTGWEKSDLRADLAKALTLRQQESTERKGRQVLSRLRLMLVTLQEHLGNAELYKVEMITSQKNLYDAAYQGRLAEKIQARQLDRDVPDGFRFWPFEGEYWVDELGWYEINTVNECMEIKKR
jgi:tetratricopeptide (TPR) repeat protein